MFDKMRINKAAKGTSLRRVEDHPDTYLCEDEDRNTFHVKGIMKHVKKHTVKNCLF